MLTFRNEVGGKWIFKFFLVLKRVMILCIGHGSWFKPTIKYFWNTLQNSTTRFWRNGQMVDIFPVQIAYFVPWKFFEFLYRSNANNLLEVIRSPEGNRSTPVPIPWNAPIVSIFQPITKTFVLFVFQTFIVKLLVFQYNLGNSTICLQLKKI